MKISFNVFGDLSFGTSAVVQRSWSRLRAPHLGHIFWTLPLLWCLCSPYTWDIIRLGKSSRQSLVSLIYFFVSGQIVLTNEVCVRDGDISYIIPTLDGDKPLFRSESAVKTFILKETATGLQSRKLFQLSTTPWKMQPTNALSSLTNNQYFSLEITFNGTVHPKM